MEKKINMIEFSIDDKTKELIINADGVKQRLSRQSAIEIQYLVAKFLSETDNEKE